MRNGDSWNCSSSRLRLVASPRPIPNGRFLAVFFTLFVGASPGAWSHLNDILRGDLRVLEGRNRQPSAASIDSQSVKMTDRGGIKGFDGAKWAKTNRMKFVSYRVTYFQRPLNVTSALVGRVPDLCFHRKVCHAELLTERRVSESSVWSRDRSDARPCGRLSHDETGRTTSFTL